MMDEGPSDRDDVERELLAMAYQRDKWLSLAERMVKALERTNHLTYGLALDLRQAILAQKIIDENRSAIAEFRKARDEGK